MARPCAGLMALEQPEMKFRPLHDRVALRRVDSESKTSGGIIIPEKSQERATTGKVVTLGLWKPNKQGNLIAYDFKRGDRVVVNAHRGRWIHEAKDRMKLVEANDILAVL